MLFFDIGANRGDASLIALQKGYDVIALEPAPKIFKKLVCNFLYNKNILPLKFAVSDIDYKEIEFYEAFEDGLSSINKDWLTSDSMPYAGKEFRSISATTITLDTLCKIYGNPDLAKIDVEGAEWSVFKGMTKKIGKLTFEWTINTIDEHVEQIKYLHSLGYSKVGPQFIEHHLQEPEKWFDIDSFSFKEWVNSNSELWTNEGWKKSNLRPTADVGMCWIK